MTATYVLYCINIIYMYTDIIRYRSTDLYVNVYLDLLRANSVT
jgi:hypothetical protein